MGWRAVVAKGTLKRLLPFKPQLRRFKRQFSGYDPVLPSLWSTISHAAGIFRELEAAKVAVEGAAVLEIGTGWFPVIPLLFRLKGAKSVILTDIDPFLDPVSFESARRFLITNMDKISREIGFDAAQARVQLETYTDLQRASFTYRCPFDPATLSDASLDLIYSRTVLEHIPPSVLVGLFQALKPKMKPGAVMVHLVDESDHLEHLDKSISRVNFLTMPPLTWAVVNSCWDYQNRLRHHEFLPLFAQAGFSVRKQSAWVDPKVLARLPELVLVAPFNTMTSDEIAIMESVFVLEAQ